MELKLIKPIIIIASVIGIVAVSFLIIKKDAVSIISDSQNKTQATNTSQGLKAYVDPVTGEFISEPSKEDPSVNSLTTEETQENNSFPVTFSEDGSVGIDTSQLRAPLIATEIDGKILIEHTKANKETK